MTDPQFGELLSKHRLAVGLTQEQLAGKAGLTAQAISALERGSRQSPRRRTVQALAEALELADSELDDFTASIAPRAPRRTGVAGEASPVRCLPPAVGDFTGRTGQVDRLQELLSPHASSATVVVSAIGGMGGVGKTALAVHVGHQLAEAFPDGQLYVNLRGFGPGEPMSVADALSVLSASLGLGETSPQVDRAVARFRAALADKRILIILDNAADERQVECLLPTAVGSAAIVTSRRTLAALPGAQHIQLDVLTDDEAVELLTSIIGDDRAAGDDQVAVNRIAELCGRLPLAIRIAGARLAARPGWPLVAFAEQLADVRRRLDLLEQHDAGVRASVAVSVSQLTQSLVPVERAAAAAMPYLGVLELTDLEIRTVARLIDKPIGETERIMDRLVDLHLIDEHSPGRYRMHDLVRTFASEQARSELADHDRAAGLVRVLELHNSTAWRVLQRSNPTHVRLAFKDAAWDRGDSGHVNLVEADEWISGEWPNLISLMEQAGRDPGVPAGLITQVAISSLDTFHPRGLWGRWLAVIEVSLRIAMSCGDAVGEAFARYDIGGAQSQLGHLADGALQLEMALELFKGAGSPDGEAMASCHLAHLLEMLGRYDEGAVLAHRSLEIAERSGHSHLAATACLALSMLYGRIGEAEREHEYSQRSLELFERIAYQPGRARALYNLGLVHSRTGRSGSALRLLLNAAEACEDIGLSETGAAARAEAAAVRVRQRRPDLAVRDCEAALDRGRDARCDIAEARLREALGGALAAMGQTARARTEWRRALVIYDRLGAAAAADVRGALARSGGTSSMQSRTHSSAG